MSDLRETLLAIREENGRLTPQLVVDAARDPSSPLHSRFEWDNAVAGEAYRREQAADLIRSVKVKYTPIDDGPQGSVRAFHAIKDTKHGHVYAPLEEVVNDPITRQLLLRDMDRDWKALKDRWKNFREFWDTVRSDVEQSA